VYKLHRLTSTELTFVLTNGGHNAGVVSEPGHANRHYAMLTSKPGDPVRDPHAWQAHARQHQGSWWTAWHAWLLARGTHAQVPARRIDPGAALCDAPGTYVMVRYND
jgi:polyhydroxyalkanoate synthase